MNQERSLSCSGLGRGSRRGDPSGVVCRLHERYQIEDQAERATLRIYFMRISSSALPRHVELLGFAATLLLLCPTLSDTVHPLAREHTGSHRRYRQEPKPERDCDVTKPMSNLLQTALTDIRLSQHRALSKYVSQSASQAGLRILTTHHAVRISADIVLIARGWYCFSKLFQTRCWMPSSIILSDEGSSNRP